MKELTKIYVRVLSEGQWFGAWAPIEVVAKDDEEHIFIIAENDLTEDDEYEFFEPGTEVRVETFTDECGEAFVGIVEGLNEPIEKH